MSDIEIFDTLSDSEKPWNRQSMRDAGGVVRWETAKAHAAFRAYAEMGDTRSVVAVSKVLGKSRTLLERWSRRWKWTERAAAYDNIMEEAVRAGLIKARRDMAVRQSRGAVLGQNIALTALMDLQSRLQARGKRRPLSPYECVRLFESCSKIERICRGEPADGEDVAVIRVFVDLQKQPRYDAAAELTRADDPAKDYDS